MGDERVHREHALDPVDIKPCSLAYFWSCLHGDSGFTVLFRWLSDHTCVETVLS